MQLELVAITPYLHDLPEDKQIEIKLALSEKLFGQGEESGGKLDSKTTGTLVDVLKMAVEAIKSFASKQ